MQESYNLDWDYVRWQSPERIYSTLGSYNDRCVGVAGLFPGLRWRGAFLAVSAFLTPAKHIFSVANVLQSFAIGKDTPYLAGNELTTLSASLMINILCSSWKGVRGWPEMLSVSLPFSLFSLSW